MKFKVSLPTLRKGGMMGKGPMVKIGLLKRKVSGKPDNMLQSKKGRV